MQEFIGEDDLKTFDGWLKYQAVDAATLTPEGLERWQAEYADAREHSAANPKVGLMKLRPLLPGEHRYAVALREGPDLWLTLWVRYSPKSGFFVLHPSHDRELDAHTSYHPNGMRHMKRRGSKVFDSEQRQPLTGAFRRSEELGVYFGHAPKSVGAVCDPAAFTGVVEVPAGVLGPRDGGVSVALVEPAGDRVATPSSNHARFWASVSQQRTRRSTECREKLTAELTARMSTKNASGRRFSSPVASITGCRRPSAPPGRR